MADEILEKANNNVVASGFNDNLGAGVTTMAESSGLLNAEQANEFIDYMWDATTLAKEGRRVIMRSNTVDLDKIAVGERIIRKATEATDTSANAPVTFSKISLTTEKIRLDWEVSTEAKEDSIEGAGTATHIARLFAAQAGNDIEDLAINGDAAGATAGLNIIDGFVKRSVGQAHTLDGNEDAVSRATFDRALKKLPRKYKANRSALRFYAGSGVVQDYLTSLTATVSGEVAVDTLAADVLRGTISGPQGAGGGRYPLAFGVPVIEVPLFDESANATVAPLTDYLGRVELTVPSNRIWGIKRDIEFYDEFKPRKDSTEYTMYMRFGIQVENWDAYVAITDVRVKAA
jgi:phage antirepressor YoqD-like protein